MEAFIRTGIPIVDYLFIDQNVSERGREEEREGGEGGRERERERIS